MSRDWTPSYRANPDSLAESEALARCLGASLLAPCVLALDGDLGAGKTTFTRGLVDGVQDGEGDFVASPTWAVCHAYETDPPVNHFDLYRLSGEDDLESVGFRDALEGAIVIVEWPGRVHSVAELVDLELRLRVTGEFSRSVELMARSRRGHEMIAALGAPWEPVAKD